MLSQLIPCPIRTFPSESSKTQCVSDQKLGNKSRCQIGKVMIGVAMPMTSSMRLQRTFFDGLLVSIKEKTLMFPSVFPVGSRQSQVNLFYLAVEKAIALQTSLFAIVRVVFFKNYSNGYMCGDFLHNTLLLIRTTNLRKHGINRTVLRKKHNFDLQQVEGS